MNLLQDNKWIVNNPTTLDKYDLGLKLSKGESGTGGCFGEEKAEKNSLVTE